MRWTRAFSVGSTHPTLYAVRLAFGLPWLMQKQQPGLLLLRRGRSDRQSSPRRSRVSSGLPDRTWPTCSRRWTCRSWRQIRPCWILSKKGEQRRALCLELLSATDIRPSQFYGKFLSDKIVGFIIEPYVDTTWGVPSLVVFCFVLLQKLRLPIGLHSSCSICLTAGGTCHKCFTNYHD